MKNDTNYLQIELEKFTIIFQNDSKALIALKIATPTLLKRKSKARALTSS